MNAPSSAPPPTSDEPAGAAFFDLDKTVVARSVTYAFGPGFFREGLVGRRDALKGAYAQLAYQLLGANEERMERGRVALLELTKGWPAQQVRRLVRETLQEVVDPIVYAEALDLFAQHRQAGRVLYLVSSSSEEIVRPLAEYLGVPRVIATRPQVDDQGCYDGTLAFYCYGPHKATAITREAAEHGFDLTRCFAYSDSVTDLPMLRAVGHPVAVNPDRALRSVAREQGWEVRDFARPVRLRPRLPELPRARAEAVLTVGAVAGLAAAGYVVRDRVPALRHRSRRDRIRPARLLRARA